MSSSSRLQDDGIDVIQGATVSHMQSLETVCWPGSTYWLEKKLVSLSLSILCMCVFVDGPWLLERQSHTRIKGSNPYSQAQFLACSAERTNLVLYFYSLS